MRKSHILLMVLLTAVTVGLGGCSHVGADWKAAQAADTTEAYQDFLHQHPDSEFGVTAQERIKQLAEDRDWQAASKTDTLDAYQQFVAAHADGKWAQEARVRIENFQLSGNGQAPAAGTSAAAGGAGTVDAPLVAAAPVATDKPDAPPTANPTVKSAAAKAAPAAVPASESRAAPATHKSRTAKAATKASSKASASAASTHHHMAQLGAYGSKASAASAWHKLSAKYPELKSLKPHYATGKRHGKIVVRLQVGVSSAKQSRALCSSLKKQSQPCVPLG